jgi:hypothetical protein
VAHTDQERGRQQLARGRPGEATSSLRTACLHWLVTGNAGLLGKTLTGLAEALRQPGQSDLAEQVLVSARDGRLTAPQLAALVPLTTGSEAAPPQDGHPR